MEAIRPQGHDNDVTASRRILLINPPGKCYILQNCGSVAERKHCQPPLGLAYVAAAAEKAGYEVHILDILAEGYSQERLVDDNSFLVYGLDVEDAVARAKDIKPDLIGFSVLFSHLAMEVYKYVDALKASMPDVPIVLGGHHPSSAPLNVLGHNKNVDYVISGEGDSSFPVFLDTLFGPDKNRSRLGDVRGLYYRDRQDPSVIRNSMDNVEVEVKGRDWAFYSRKNGPNPGDLGAIPRPAWHLFNMEKYWDCDVRMGGSDIVSNRYGVMVSTRGCPHVCYYCTSPLMSGYRGYLKREIKDVTDEIAWLVDEYGVEEIQFLDNNFFINSKRAKELLREVAEKFPDLVFSVPAGTEVNSLDEEMIRLMAEARFYRIALAVESGDQEIQDRLIDKQVDISSLPRIIDLCRKYGLEVRAYFMIGFPGETMDQVLKTANLALDLNLDDIALSIVAPLPGTPLFDECLEKELFIDKFNVNDIRYSVSQIKLEDVAGEDLEGIRREYWLKNMERKKQRSEIVQRHRVYKDAEDYSMAGFETDMKTLGKR